MDHAGSIPAWGSKKVDTIHQIVYKYRTRLLSIDSDAIAL